MATTMTSQASEQLVERRGRHRRVLRRSVMVREMTNRTGLNEREQRPARGCQQQHEPFRVHAQPLAKSLRSFGV